MKRARRRRVPSMRILSITMFFAAVVFSALLLFTTVRVTALQDSLNINLDDYLALSDNANKLVETSNDMSADAHQFVMIHNQASLTSYARGRAKLQVSLNDMRRAKELVASDSDVNLLDSFLDELEVVVDREIHALALTASANKLTLPSSLGSLDSILTEEELKLPPDLKEQAATNLIFGLSYQSQFDQALVDVRSLLHTLVMSRNIEQAQALQRITNLTTNERILTVALLLSVVVIVFANIVLMLVPLSRMIDNIEAKKALPEEGARELRSLTAAYNDMYEQVQSREAYLTHVAQHDPLTGLLNRASWEQYLELFDASEGAPAVSGALLLIDIDYFKVVNDENGHDVGDEVLRRVAHALQTTFRSTDYLFRIGGDEFAAFLPEISPARHDICIAKCKSLATLLADDEGEVPGITISIGIAFTEERTAEESLFKAADLALYETKERGRASFTFRSDLAA